MTAMPDRSAEAVPQPCARHEVCVMLIVRADVPVDTTGKHLRDYLDDLITGEDAHQLHEDTFDGICDAPMRVTAVPQTGDSIMRTAATLLSQDESCHAITEAAECMLDAAESPRG